MKKLLSTKGIIVLAAVALLALAAGLLWQESLADNRVEPEPAAQISYRIVIGGEPAGTWPEEKSYSSEMAFRVVFEPGQDLPRPGKYSPGNVTAPDFAADEFLIYAYLGEYSTTGYGIAVEEITLEETELTVQLRTAGPAPDAMTGQAFTHPHTAVAASRSGVPAGEYTVRFTDQNQNQLAEQEVEFPPLPGK